MNWADVQDWLSGQTGDMIFRFGFPVALALLVLLPFVLWWLRYRERRRQVTVDLPVTGLLATVTYRDPRKWRLLLDVLRVAALGLMIIGIARPQYGKVERQTFSEGIDIAIVLDVSLSMRNGDFHPNRLEAAKEVIKQFVMDRKGDRLSLVIFGSEAATLVPLTLDSGVVYSFVDRVKFNLVPGDKTAIGMGLATALDRLRDSTAKSKVAILLTDGENNAGKIEPMKAAEAAKALGVKVYTIGVGSNVQQGFFGFAPEAGLDENSLTQMASATGGKYFRADNEQKLKDIYDNIDKLEKSKIEATQFDNFNELVVWLALPALVLLMLELALRTTRYVVLP